MWREDQDTDGALRAWAERDWEPELPDADEDFNEWWFNATIPRYEYLSRKHDEGEKFPYAA